MTLVLTRKEDGALKPICYVSKALYGAKLKYPPLEKLVYALITAVRVGLYWSTMKKDSIEFIMKLDGCQKFTCVRKQPPVELTSIIAPWSFVQWGLNLFIPFPRARC